jgi:hypothetical protein
MFENSVLELEATLLEEVLQYLKTHSNMTVNYFEN